MKVKVKKLHPNAVIPFKTYNDDFCFDAVAVTCEEVAPNVYRYGLGLAFEIDYDANAMLADHLIGHENELIASIEVRPRSSVWKTGMVLSCSMGTIDKGYRGEVSAVFYHVMPNMPRYQVGDKVCQIMLNRTEPIEFVEVEELSKSKRGENGYGSTDIKKQLNT